jgi:spermidine/putrescine transport system ATP-binding protein
VGDKVDLQWNPQHTFLLDASQDATAGAEPEEEP